MSTAPYADRDAPRPSSRLADLVSKLDNLMRAGKGKKVPPKGQNPNSSLWTAGGGQWITSAKHRRRCREVGAGEALMGQVSRL